MNTKYITLLTAAALVALLFVGGAAAQDAADSSADTAKITTAYAVKSDDGTVEAGKITVNLKDTRDEDRISGYDQIMSSMSGKYGITGGKSLSNMLVLSKKIAETYAVTADNHPEINDNVVYDAGTKTAADNQAGLINVVTETNNQRNLVTDEIRDAGYSQMYSSMLNSMAKSAAKMNLYDYFIADTTTPSSVVYVSNGDKTAAKALAFSSKNDTTVVKTTAYKTSSDDGKTTVSASKYIANQDGTASLATVTYSTNVENQRPSTSNTNTRSDAVDTQLIMTASNSQTGSDDKDKPLIVTKSTSMPEFTTGNPSVTTSSPVPVSTAGDESKTRTLVKEMNRTIVAA